MSTEHDSLTVDPRLETLLRGILASDDLQPTQNERVRARLGLLATEPAGAATLTIPASRAQIATPEPEAAPLAAPPQTRLRRQWLQFALAAVAFIAVGVLLVLLFGSGNDDSSDSRTGTEASPITGMLDDALTVEEARARLSFDLIVPDAFPDALSIAGVFVAENNRSATIWLANDGETTPRITVTEILGQVTTPSAENMQRALLESLDQPPATSLPQPSQTTIIVAGRTILQTVIYGGNGESLYLYSWSQGEIHLDVDSFGGAKEDIEQVVNAFASIPDIDATPEPATPSADDEDVSTLPTPDEMGMYRDITLDQAQAIVPFEIVVPEQVPDGLDQAFITVIEAPQVSGEPNYRVEMSFGLAGDESPSQSIQFLQRDSPPPMTGIPEGATPLGTLNGIDVFQTNETNAAGDPLITYQWQHNDVGYLIIARTVGDLTPELVDKLLQAIFVSFTPTAEGETARLEQERAEMMQFPIPDTCAASDWAGPDFRVGQQYPTAYYLDGDGLSLWTTHGLLFAGENEITWLADAPLTTTEALSGPETIQAVQAGADGATTEIPIDVTEQIYNVRDTERAWWSTVNFPSEGCWEIEVSLGVHTLSATVYVYPQPPSGEFPQIDGAVMVDAAQLGSDDLPFAASDVIGTIHVVATNPIDVNSYYSVPTQALRDAGWSGGGFLTQQYASYSGWANGNRIVLFIIIPGGAQDVFRDEVGAIDLGPFPDALDEVGDNEVLIYTRTAQCEEATPDDCMRKAFEAVNGPSGRP
ncbi:MAG TPA: hypothetical protein VFV93_02900 [Thermomicrobiales bacterium]|nr:hypothetical protein [Thermomicrobiales bacterium]